MVIAAIAYYGPDNDGWLKTVSFDSSGAISAVIDSLEFDADFGVEVSIVHVSGVVYAIAYRGPDSDGWLCTVSIDSAGEIGDTVIDTLEFEAGTGSTPHIIHVSGDIFAIAYQGPDSDGWLCTVDIDSAGNIGAAVIDTLEFDADTGATPSIVHVSGDFYAIAYIGPGSDGWLCTVEIDSAGNIAAAVEDTLEFDVTNAVTPHILHVTGDIFVIVYQGGGLGLAVTVDIDSTGDIAAAVVDTLTFDAVVAVAPSIVHVSGEIYAIAYQGVDQDGWLRTYPISSAGAFGAGVDNLEFEALLVGSPQIIYGTGIIYVLAYDISAGGAGWVGTVDISVAGTIGAVLDTQVIDAVKGGLPQIIKIVIPPDGLYVELARTEIQTQVFAVRVTRGRESELKAAGTGVAEITVDNKDGDYSPENAGGAYYGTLDLGNPIYVYEVYDGVIYPIFTGTIEKVVPSDAPDDATAFILATDGLDDLAVDPIDTVLRTSVKGGVLVGDILDAVPAFAGARDIDTGVTTFDVAYFAGMTARAALLMLDDQERSFHYIDVDGDFQWEDRHHRLKGAHLVSQYDFEDEHIFLAYEWSKRELYNQVRIMGTKYTSDPDTEYLWGTEAGVSGTAVVVPAGGSVTIWATFNQVLASFTAFVQGTHWNTNTVIDKTGVDTSDDVSVAVTQYGKALKIVFTSTSALNSFLVVPDSPPTGSDADRSAIVMGKLYQEDQILHIEVDTTSRDDYKLKALSLTAPFKSDPDELRVMAEWLVNLHKDPAPRSVIASFHARVNWPTDAILKQMLGRKISDRITLKSTRLGVDQDFYIDKVVHDWQQYEGLFNLKVDWTLSRASDLGGAFWILEEAGYGELEETTVLGF